MIAPTKLYDKFPTISPAQAADLVVKAMVERPHEINTLLGNAGAVLTRSPRSSPSGSSTWPTTCSPTRPRPRARTPRSGTRESEQIMLAKVFKGVHW